MTVTNSDTKAPSRGKRGCLRVFGRLLGIATCLLVAFLFWLNGPGMRWLGPKLASHFLGKAGMEVTLELRGTLLGGLEIRDLSIRAGKGTVERIEWDRLAIGYDASGLLEGRLRDISGEGLRAVLRVEESEETGEVPDFAEIARQVEAARLRFSPLAVDLRDISVLAQREGERVFELKGASLLHQAGDDKVVLETGSITDASGRSVLKQKVELVWRRHRILVGKMDVLPVLGLRTLEIDLPEDGMISAQGEIRFRGAIFKLDVGEGIRDVRLDLLEGEWDFGNPLAKMGVGRPLQGKVTSLAAELRECFPDWKNAVGSVETMVEGFSYQGWEVEEASLSVVLDQDRVGAKLVGKALGSNFSAEGGGAFLRSALDQGGTIVDRLDGRLRIDGVADVLRSLDRKLKWPQDFATFPDSVLEGGWSVSLAADGFESAEVGLKLEAVEADASAIRLDAAFGNGLLTVRRLAAEGLEFSGTYDLAAKGYEARNTLQDFRSERIGPWVEGAGIALPGAAVVSMEWQGSGNLTDRAMRGGISAVQATINIVDEEGGERVILAGADRISYDWPDEIVARGLKLQTMEQSIELDAEWVEQAVNLSRLTWHDGDVLLAKGSGKIPMPQDFSKFREFVAKDERALDFSLVSERLPLVELKPWIKGLDWMDEKATGKVTIRVGGSMAAPVVLAEAEIRDIQVPEQPAVPRTDIRMRLEASEGEASLMAEVLAAGYAPAVLDAKMAFRPKAWAGDEELLFSEPVQGRLDLPRLELARFLPLMTAAKELGGVATGKIELSGTVGEPVIRGDLRIQEGRLLMRDDAIPEISGTNMDLTADLKTVSVKGSIKDLAGGNLGWEGVFDWQDRSNLDLKLRGAGLPILRNEFLILRANADLRATGSLDEASVKGEVSVIDSVFYKDIELLPIGKPFLGPAAASLPKVDAPQGLGFAMPEPFAKWQLDVAVKTADPILIRGNLGRGRVDGTVRLGGTLSDPLPDGLVRITKATARLPFSTLAVREGILTFTPQDRFDPTLEIRASAEPRPYRVQVYAYGKLSDPQLVLTSEPPMPDTEIMTLLATGTTTAGLEDSSAASSRAMQLLIEEMRRGRFLFGDRLRPVLGLLDDVDFSLAETDPYDADSYSSATLRLSRNWYLSAGLGAQGDQRVMAIWRLRFR